ncbi:MAG TPA: hypothetical protein VNA65_00875 [Candidatus Dormibacteraeota bacterium]|nr:hypothetical protein [Candidatus Dormibacteraeota bacterium]
MRLAQRRKDVEPQRTTDVHETDRAGRDASGKAPRHLGNRCIRDSDEDDAILDRRKGLARGYEVRLVADSIECADQAAAEVAAAGYEDLVRRLGGA